MRSFLHSSTVCILASGALLIVAQPAAAQSGQAPKPIVVYTNDFEKDVGAEWSQRQTDVTPRGKRRFLGQFGVDEVGLALTGLPAHQFLRVSFDLYLINTWDGGNEPGTSTGPDAWSLEVKGGPELLRCTFANSIGLDQQKQSYPDAFPGPLHQLQTGAAEKQTLGYQFREYTMDAVYRLSFVFPHADANVTMFFAAAGLQSLEDESWGLDNVTVEALPEAGKASAEQLAALWRQLGDDDPVQACPAIPLLVLAGEPAVAFLAGQLKGKGLDEGKIAKLLADLDANEWKTRENASIALQKMGPGVVPFLRKAIKTKTSEEVRWRIRDILDGFEQPAQDSPESLRYGRAIRVLSAVHSKQALAVLKELAAAAPNEEMHAHAQAAMDRIAENHITPLLAAARERADGGDLAAAAKLCGEAFALADDADHYIKDDVRKVLDDLQRRQKAGEPAPPAGKMHVRWKGRVLDLGGDVRLKLVLVPAGKFLMGSAEGDQGHKPDEAPQHEVAISKPFYMGVTEISQEQYQAVMGRNPSHFKGARRPVETVSWADAAAFCGRLSRKTGWTVRLPTEAEWEYACRAESTTPFGFGDGTKALQQHAWVLDNSEGETHPVGHMRPNAWGLFDLHGNVAEWCGDRYGEKYYADSPKADPKGPADGQGRVCRGGAWSGDWQAIRSAARTGSGIDEKSSAVGFRVVVEAE